MTMNDEEIEELMDAIDYELRRSELAIRNVPQPVNAYSGVVKAQAKLNELRRMIDDEN